MSRQEQPGPDEKQLEAIGCDVNAVVSAGAGSGKTFVLTERYFRLIAEGHAGVDQILTLTFTRKAAAEMFERIYHRLLQGKEQSSRVREQIQKFDEAQISTLDSFCSQIARSGSGLFGIAPDFAIDNPGSKDLAEKTALNFLLRHSDDPVLKAYIVQFGFERVWRDFFTSYGFEYIDCVVPKDFTAMEKRQQDFLKVQLSSHGKKLLSAADRILGLDPADGSAVLKNHEALASVSEIHTAFSDNDFHRIVELVSGIVMSKRGVGNSKKESIRLLGELIEEIREQQKPVLQIAGTLAMWRFNTGVFLLLQEFQEELIKEKRKLGILSFHDVLRMAIEVLKRDRGIRDFYKSMFRYIMIDEFQDNNALQKQLLYLLAEKKELFNDVPEAEQLEPGKLFFVGDDKQSIYRFRGADVRVFKNLCDELTGERGVHIAMDKNYRSNAGLIGFFNYMFRSVLGDSAGAGSIDDNRTNRAAYEADFLPLQPGIDRKEHEAEISILYKPYDETEDKRLNADSDETEAYAVAEYIKERVEAKSLYVRECENFRTAGYSDFALLMRSTSNQAVYERIFRQTGIPYTTDNIRTLFLEAPFNDFYNLLQLALFPSDRVAYAGYLRSPLVRCSDDTILRLLLADEGVFPESPVSHGPEPDSTEKDRYEAGKALYMFIRDRIDIWPLGRIVEYIWYEAGYRYELLTNPACHPYLEYYDYLYYLAVDADKRGSTMSEFLDFMRENLGKYERIEEIDILKESREGVQILTIHKSKGLEFPIVVLSNTGNVGNRGAGPALYYNSPEFGITFSAGEGSGKSANYFYSLLKEEEKKMNIAEVKRLLYVSCTRAKDHLVISGYHHRNNRNSDDAMLNMTMRALGVNQETEDGIVQLSTDEGNPAGTVQFRQIHELPKTAVMGRLPQGTYKDRKIKIDKYFEMPVTAYKFGRQDFSVTELADHQLMDFTEDELQQGSRILPTLETDNFITDEDGAAALGSLVHFVMEQKLLEAYSWNMIPPAYLSRFSKTDLPVIQTTIEKITDRFFRSTLFEKVRNARRINTEYDFITLYRTGEGEKFVFGRIDLLVETDTEVVVIDFKTDKYYFPEVHSRQLHIYARAARALNDKPIRCYLYFMRNGEAAEVTPDFSFVPLFPRAEVYYGGET